MDNEELLNRCCKIFNDTNDNELKSKVYDTVFDYYKFRVSCMRMEQMRVKGLLESMEEALDNAEDC